MFEKIAKEDLPYIDDDDFVIPGFGNSKSEYAEVHTFYAYWQSYSTPKTFAYICNYSSLDAPNRRIARLIDKENSKLREAAKKERNLEIRVSHRPLAYLTTNFNSFRQ